MCSEHLFVEFVDDNGNPIKGGELGRIVVTELTNYGMPFIRYEIGDVGRPLDKICFCGKGLLMMEIGEGRTTDFVITPNGKLIHGEFSTHLFYRTMVSHFLPTRFLRLLREVSL